LRRSYAAALTEIAVAEPPPEFARFNAGTLAAARDELAAGLRGLLGADVPIVAKATRDGALLVGTPRNPDILALVSERDLRAAGEEGYILRRVAVGGQHRVLLAANREIGLLYGAFALLRHLQTQQPIEQLDVVSAPRIQRRLLNHWDNLNRTVERGYAGQSLWEWFVLPEVVSPRYRDYARACASVGLNGAVLNNVNADALILTAPWLQKVAALARELRPYGVRVYLSARFSAPIEIGGLKTADPLDRDVIRWWREKAAEIYRVIPDFGGFLVKANSEGQPGPQAYGRTHADGANLLADAVALNGGLVIWRAFVYDDQNREDRAKQAFSEFAPLDGRFRDNVLVQVKNGPIDFMPREPFHPLFGAMPRTPLALELQITQEYLGQGTQLAFLAPMWKEVLDADTFRPAAGATVARIVDGTAELQRVSAIAGVANIGTDLNWTGHPLAQANWYAFGRLAWDHTLTSAQIAEEWTRQTFSNDPRLVAPLTAMLLASREAVVDYSMPLGLHHLMATGHHYGPGPWVSDLKRADWNPVYYHRADERGLGFDRTATGSDALAQYAPAAAARWAGLATCPDEFLLWFHHVPWDYRMRSGRPLWDELCLRYQRGVDTVRAWQKTWDGLQPLLDAERFAHVRGLLARQERDAREWRDACTQYFASFSKRPLPAGVEPPEHPLEFYQNKKYDYQPGWTPSK
jgi:alpha-glucuronidase